LIYHGAVMMEEKASRIRLLVLDVDGVMTDGRIILNERGEETKHFNAKDGHGLKMLVNAGIDVAIITGRKSGAVEARAKELGIRDVSQGVKDKSSHLASIIQGKALKKDQVCVVGDDLPDLPMFQQAGVAVAVADAAVEVREAANLITKSRGGGGAVREVCELIMKAQNLWPSPANSTR
jgi:3-deoxy-D-manno-octulosonate 8-phosphate phosphatase (KDO 8-P phosphatase)